MGSPTPATFTHPRSPKSPQNQSSPSNPSQKASWFSFDSEKVLPASSLVSDVKVVNGVAKTVILEGLIKNFQPLWKNYIVRFFIGDAPHIGKVHATVNRLWSSDKLTKIDAQFLNPKTVLFSDRGSTYAKACSQEALLAYWGYPSGGSGVVTKNG
ncbi:unnamed protein product [Arabis nemorensis]|uniref:DUF4283 domain-containing protein n=1 Tax=Arabis nemorensis TaxID=586526 RepID=A0A565BIE2_9BRAS|nr:unnamed protein product [Arabis nemorensis]